MVVIRLSRSGAKKTLTTLLQLQIQEMQEMALLLKDLDFTILQLKAKKKHYV